AHASSAARKRNAPARSGSTVRNSVTSAAFRGSRSAVSKPPIGATAARPATRPSQNAATPIPSGETTPHPVITALRVGAATRTGADYSTPVRERQRVGSAAAERLLVDRSRLGGGRSGRRRTRKRDRILPLQHPRRHHVRAGHRRDPDGL